MAVALRAAYGAAEAVFLGMDRGVVESCANTRQMSSIFPPTFKGAAVSATSSYGETAGLPKVRHSSVHHVQVFSPVHPLSVTRARTSLEPLLSRVAEEPIVTIRGGKAAILSGCLQEHNAGLQQISTNKMTPALLVKRD